MSEGENRYYHFHKGLLDANFREGRVTSLRTLTRLPIYSEWRNSLGGRTHSTEFLTFLDDLVSGRKKDCHCIAHLPLHSDFTSA